MNRSNNTVQIPETLRQMLDSPLDVKLALLEHHMEISMMLVREIIDEDMVQHAGERYSRDKPHGGRYNRWGSNPGSVRIGNERVPLEVPRLRDNLSQTFRPLESYQQLHRGVDFSDQLHDSILLGLSTGDYGRVASNYVDGFGLSQSSVSRAFQERSRRALEEFERRSLGSYDFIGLWIDGKTQAKQQIVIALGLTMEGRKIPLGFVQATTENSTSVKGLLQDLVDRGFVFSEGLLCIIDGSKALSKAIVEVFGGYALVQRCQWHKRENVLGYLGESDQKIYRRKLQQAYQKPEYTQAKTALMQIHSELEQLNRSAARSLMEGFEQTLTLHRLGLFDLLGRSLKTTNCIENLNSQLTKYTGRVKYWTSSDQRHRWVAAGLMEVEKKMRRIDNWKHLELLRQALKRELELNEKT